MSNIIKGITQEDPITKKEPEVQVPGYGTMPLDMLKRHVQSLSKDFNDSIQKGEFLKAAYRTEQFYNALMALAKALPKPNKVDEGKVAPLYPLVIAGHPFNWNVYDLRNNKMVANILGGDRWDSKMYEIRINRSGMTPTTRMLPTYVLTAGAHDNPPYKAYELVAPEGGFGKIEKSPGPGGTTKLRPDQNDMLRHLFKNLGGGKYYGYDLVLVEEGLDQWELIEKALGAKIMDVDTAMELGYTDIDPEDSSGIIYLGNKVDESLPTSPGGMGQSYRKYTAKPAGLGEEQAPMFTPEEKMVNANDPRSAGWRTYKIGPAGLEENDMKIIDETDTLKTNALKVIYDSVMSELRNTQLYPNNEQDFIRVASAVLKRQIGRRYPHLSQQQIIPASQNMAKDLLQFYKQEPNTIKYKQVSGDNYTESSILQGLNTLK